MKKHYKIKEVAEQLGVSPSTVRNLILRGDLAAIDLGLGSHRNFRVSEADLEAFRRSRIAPPPVKRQKRISVKNYL